MSSDQISGMTEASIRGSVISGSGTLAGTLKRALDVQPVLTAASLVLVIVAWYAVVLLTDMPIYVLPPPHQVALEIIDRAPLLGAHALVTLKEILTAFWISVLIGIPLGMVLSFLTIVGKLLYPLLIISQAVPKVALAPLFLAWFGFGFTTNIAVGVLVAIFPIIINTHLGLQAIDPDLIRLGRAMGASRIRLFLKIRLPVALPSIFAGLKLGMTFSAIGAVIGEFVAGSEGLGYIIQAASGRLDTVLSIAGIVVISAMAVVLFRLVELLEKFMLRHRN